MRRRLWAPFFSLQFTTTCHYISSSTNSKNKESKLRKNKENNRAQDQKQQQQQLVEEENNKKFNNNNNNKDKVEYVSSQRLVNSLGFSLTDMESLVRSFNTGEKPPLICLDKNKNKIKYKTRLVDACRTSPDLLPLLEEINLAFNSIYNALSQNRVNNNNSNEEFTSLLHRSALQVEKDIKIQKIESLSLLESQICAILVLTTVMRELMRKFRYEGKEIYEKYYKGNGENRKQINEWRYEVIKAHVKAFSTLDKTCNNIFVEYFKNENIKICKLEELQIYSLCSTSIISSIFFISDELQWHISRPSVKSNAFVEDEEEIVLIESQIKHFRYSILKSASFLLEKSIEIDPLLTKNIKYTAQLSYCIYTLENILNTLETSRNPSNINNDNNSTENKDSYIFSSLITWMLFLISLPASQFYIPSIELERRFINCFQQLWRRAAPILERRLSDKLIIHRTIHSSLNIRYTRCREIEEENSKENIKLTFLSFPIQGIQFLKLLENTAKTFYHWQLKREKAIISMLIPYSVLCRTMLEIEIELYFLACKNTNRVWTTPIDFNNIKIDHMKDNLIINSPWKEILNSSSKVRIAVSSLIHIYVMTYVKQEISTYKLEDIKNRLPFIRSASYRFINSISTSFFPLLRRHYIDTGGKEVLMSCLQTFLSIKQISDIMDGDGDERIRDEKTAFRVCGINLSQATEVAFFLSLQKSRNLLQHGEFIETFNNNNNESTNNPNDNGNLIVSSYVKEVLFFLDHNTAKQLWHLRAKNIQHCFTGVECKNELIDERIQRRQTQSILSIVHAHIMHPSFLWMPLYQLQEFVFILSENRELIEGIQQNLKTNQITNDKLTNSTNVIRVGSLGGTLRHFERALGYIALRIYVVGNVLRYYRQLLNKEERISNNNNNIIKKLPLKETITEAKKREKRIWAQSMAQILKKYYIGMPAEVEGLNSKNLLARKRANVRVLARLEATINLASRHSLLFNVKKRRKLNRSKRKQEKEEKEKENSILTHDNIIKETSVDNKIGSSSLLSVSTTITTTSTSSTETTMLDNNNSSNSNVSSALSPLTLYLKRIEATTPLGFSLYGECATIRRLVNYKNEDNTNKQKVNSTPFIKALHEAGVLDPESIIGWRIIEIDNIEVKNSKAVISLVNGKREFSMTLSS